MLLTEDTSIQPGICSSSWKWLHWKERLCVENSLKGKDEKVRKQCGNGIWNV